jgi:hypothetical protein
MKKRQKEEITVGGNCKKVAFSTKVQEKEFTVDEDETDLYERVLNMNEEISNRRKDVFQNDTVGLSLPQKKVIDDSISKLIDSIASNISKKSTTLENKIKFLNNAEKQWDEIRDEFYEMVSTPSKISRKSPPRTPSKISCESAATSIEEEEEDVAKTDISKSNEVQRDLNNLKESMLNWKNAEFPAEVKTITNKNFKELLNIFGMITRQIGEDANNPLIAQDAKQELLQSATTLFEQMKNSWELEKTAKKEIGKQMDLKLVELVQKGMKVLSAEEGYAQDAQYVMRRSIDDFFRLKLTTAPFTASQEEVDERESKLATAALSLSEKLRHMFRERGPSIFGKLVKVLPAETVEKKQRL